MMGKSSIVASYDRDVKSKKLSNTSDTWEDEVLGFVRLKHVG